MPQYGKNHIRLSKDVPSTVSAGSLFIDEMATALRDVLAIGTESGAQHIYEGDCPDDAQPGARDPEYCPACRALVTAASVLQKYATEDPPHSEPDLVERLRYEAYHLQSKIFATQSLLGRVLEAIHDPADGAMLRPHPSLADEIRQLLTASEEVADKANQPCGDNSLMHDIRARDQALAYIVDCTLATVADMATKKSRSKHEYSRQISIAQKGVDWIREMGIAGKTRAQKIIKKGITVEDWAKTYEPGG